MLFNVFLKLKFRVHQGSNQGPLGLQPIALSLSYIPLNIVNRQSTLALRVYIKLVRKRSFLVLPGFLSLFCSENRPRVLQIFFHTENCFDAGILRTGDKYCTTPLYSRLFSCSTRQSLKSKKFNWWEPTPSFGDHVNSWFFSNRCPGGHFRTIPLVQNLGHPGS